MVIQMKIDDLKQYPLLYKEARKWQEKDKGFFDELMYLDIAFSWDDTVQGWEFWDYVNRYCMDDAESMHPELFEEDHLNNPKDDCDCKDCNLNKTLADPNFPMLHADSIKSDLRPKPTPIAQSEPKPLLSPLSRFDVPHYLDGVLK